MIEVLTSEVALSIHVVRASPADPLRAWSTAIAAAPLRLPHSRMF